MYYINIWFNQACYFTTERINMTWVIYSIFCPIFRLTSPIALKLITLSILNVIYYTYIYTYCTTCYHSTVQNDFFLKLIHWHYLWDGKTKMRNKLCKSMSLCAIDVQQRIKMRETKESTKAYHCGALKIHNGKTLAIYWSYPFLPSFIKIEWYKGTEPLPICAFFESVQFFDAK